MIFNLKEEPVFRLLFFGWDQLLCWEAGQPMRNPTQPEIKSRNWETVAVSELDPSGAVSLNPVFRMRISTPRQNRPIQAATST